MREIKFRVWDKKSKKMRVVSCLVFDTQSHLDKPNGIRLINLWGQPFNPSEEDNPHVLIQRLPKEVELMQYTGLKDKNGLEIYYDCQIFTIDGYSGKYILTKDDFDIPIVSNPNDVLKSISLENVIFGKNRTPKTSFEVIGNIYEHPHLLESK